MLTLNACAGFILLAETKDQRTGFLFPRAYLMHFTLDMQPFLWLHFLGPLNDLVIAVNDAKWVSIVILLAK